MIELDDVSKSFDGGRTWAVRDLSLRVEAGELLVLLGGDFTVLEHLFQVGQHLCCLFVAREGFLQCRHSVFSLSCADRGCPRGNHVP